jgi:fatty acid desaturase
MSYLSPQDRRPAFEWPNGLLILVIYGAWLTLILWYPRLPQVPATLALVVVCAWFMSLQHELLHGHPTRHAGLNRLFGLAPLAAWYPYDIYRDSHIAHHRDELLTTPGVDPESNYVDPAAWKALGPWGRFLRTAMRTVAGRFLLGPALTILEVWADIFTGPRQRGWRAVRTWGQHLALLGLLLWWVQEQSGISALHYLFGIAYPALGLAMMRSFHEHRPAPEPGHRIVVNDAGTFWRLLYLNNNYHAVHHAEPALAWYRIPARWRAQREQFLAGNGQFHYQGYGRLLWRHLFTPVDSPVHPGFSHPETPARKGA